MLFNSYQFLFLFLPVTLAGFFLLAHTSKGFAVTWLAVASLFFYGWWNHAFVTLLLASITFNYFMGNRINVAQRSARPFLARALLITGVATDLLLLTYFKYGLFLLSFLGPASPAHLDTGSIIVPLGISFYTFTQIAYLVDIYRAEVNARKFTHFALFVSYFPHLIAGPILHHKEIMPQLSLNETYRFRSENFAVGITVFAIGLFKKTILADGVAPIAAPLFDAHGWNGLSPTFMDAWIGALAYTLQLYFDFSGYSDMAIGVSRMFGIKLPINFFSPYKAPSIIQFWRRWHMTLSRFLRDYLYFSLGGNRKGSFRRYINIFLTMLLGGIWHGAGWTFIVWGALHGFYLMVNHAWISLKSAIKWEGEIRGAATIARVITFTAITIGWVIFKADNLAIAHEILRGMAGLNGFVLATSWLGHLGGFGVWLANHGIAFNQTIGFVHGGSRDLIWVAGLLIIAWHTPNTAQIMARFRLSPDSIGTENGVTSEFSWAPNFRWALLCALLLAASLGALSKPSVFLYFQF